MPSANDLRKGMAIKYNNDVCVVLDMQHRTPGNLRAFVQATLRSLKTGKSSNVRFASTESIVAVSKNTKPVDFSFKDQAGYHFPPAVDLKVLEAPPGIRGDTATNVTKQAKVETGIEVAVPIFINPGDSVRVDTRTGKYLNRV